MGEEITVPDPKCKSISPLLGSQREREDETIWARHVSSITGPPTPLIWDFGTLDENAEMKYNPKLDIHNLHV